MPSHPESHEEILIGLAAGDEDLLEQGDTIARQLAECDECLRYAFELYETFPVAMRSLGAVVPRVGDDAGDEPHEALGIALDRAMEILAARDAAEDKGAAGPSPDEQERPATPAAAPATDGGVVVPLWLRSAAGLAAAAALALVVLWQTGVFDPSPEGHGTPGLRSGGWRGAEPPSYADELRDLEQRLGAPPAGGAAAKTLTPFARGYLLGLVLDLGAGGGDVRGSAERQADVRALRELAAAWLDGPADAAARGQWRKRLVSDGCGALTASPADAAACRWGRFGEALRLADRGAEQVRSDEARSFLTWAAEHVAATGNGAAQRKDLAVLQDRAERGGVVDAAEWDAWDRLVRALLR